MKIAIVAFNCKRSKSLMYRKIDDKGDDLKLWEMTANLIFEAIRKNADFCSIRFIRGEEKE